MEQIVTNTKPKNMRRGTARWTARWTARCLSAVLMLATACGSDTAPAPTDPTAPTTKKDAGTASAKKDASTSTSGSSTAKKDAGTTGADDPNAADNSDDSASDDSASDDGTAGATGATDPGKPDTAAIARGKALAAKASPVCTACHGKDYSGAGFYPNITPDEDTGIGTWTPKQIEDAITKGLDDQGGKLCTLMQRYKLSATEVSDMVAYLRSLPPVSNEITMMCPGS